MHIDTFPVRVGTNLTRHYFGHLINIEEVLTETTKVITKLNKTKILYGSTLSKNNKYLFR